MTPWFQNHILMLFFFIWFLHEVASCLKVDKRAAFFPTSSLIALEISNRYSEEETPAVLYCPLLESARSQPAIAPFILHGCVLSHFSRVPPCAIPWTVACQAPLSIGFSRQESRSWVSMPSYRGSSQPRDQTHISCVPCVGRWVLYL